MDTVTDPGPNGIFTRRDDEALVESILRRINISVSKHHRLPIDLSCMHGDLQRLSQHATMC